MKKIIFILLSPVISLQAMEVVLKGPAELQLPHAVAKKRVSGKRDAATAVSSLLLNVLLRNTDLADLALSRKEDQSSGGQEQKATADSDDLELVVRSLSANLQVPAGKENVGDVFNLARNYLSLDPSEKWALVLLRALHQIYNDEVPEGILAVELGGATNRLNHFLQTFIERDKSWLNTCAANTTPLISAATYDAVEIAQLLIRAGADANLGNGEGYTPLMFAALNKHAGTVRYLLSVGAKVDVCAPNGFTALHLAVSAESIVVVKALLKAKANTEIHDSINKHSPLATAIYRKNSRLVQLLVENGANINFQIHGISLLTFSKMLYDAAIEPCTYSSKKTIRELKAINSTLLAKDLSLRK